jgi:protein SCO1
MRKRSGVAIAFAVALVLGGCSHDPTVPAPPASAGHPMNMRLPVAISRAGLLDSDGNRITIGSLRGKVVVISDLLTLCQETCPLDTANIVAAARRVTAAGLGNRVEFLSITVDPGRDTPTRLTAYRRLYRPAPADWLTITGAPSTLNTFWNRLGVFRKRVPEDAPAPRDWMTGRPLSYDVTHSDQVFFLDTHGHQRFVLDGTPHIARGAPVPPTIRSFLSAEGRHNMNHPGVGAWTLNQELDVLAWLLDKRL